MLIACVNQFLQKSLNSVALQQDELDDAGLLGREIMQKIVNDALKDGVPIPIHPIFRLLKTKKLSAWTFK
uniref:Calponin-homology (CH) domain-containing protein n=1 Tax=Ascaris lumbricoides TaxID=6252 RepID=A0A0M3HIC5_ASCLU